MAPTPPAISPVRNDRWRSDLERAQTADRPGRAGLCLSLLIRHLLANVADQTDAVIISGDLRLTYRDFLRRVGQLASMLAARACGRAMLWR
jgi:non-ribosomal peptide synthetase component F